MALFWAGLLGSGHCLGMCGGVVALMNRAPFRLIAGYNFGRILAYVCAGLGVGWLGEVGFWLAPHQAWRAVLYALASFLMLAMGLYLLGFPRLLMPFENVGQLLWQKIAPIAHRFLPVRHFAAALCLGFLWGFIPCGLVYSALAMSLASGSALDGATRMFCFALGTLPVMLFAPFLLSQLGQMARTIMQKMAGVMLLIFAGLGAYRLRFLLFAEF